MGIGPAEVCNPPPEMSSRAMGMRPVLSLDVEEVISPPSPPPCDIDEPPTPPPTPPATPPAQRVTTILKTDDSVSAFRCVPAAPSAPATPVTNFRPTPAITVAQPTSMEPCESALPSGPLPVAALAALGDAYETMASSNQVFTGSEQSTMPIPAAALAAMPMMASTEPVTQQHVEPQMTVAVPSSSVPNKTLSDQVVTPWYPNGRSYYSIRLRDEMEDFTTYISLSHEERSKRNALRTSVQAIVGDMGWGDATVKVYGSFAYGLAIPKSAVDLVCENCGTTVDLNSVSAALTARGLNVTSAIACGGDGGLGGFVQAEAYGVEANISFVPGESLARRTVSLARTWLQEFPAAVPVAMTLRAVLSQSRCDVPRTGGLSAYAILAMVIHVCRTIPAEKMEPGHLLYTFLLMFSQKWDFENCAVDATSEVPIERPVAGIDQVYVCDPLDPNNNIAAGCTRLVQIKAQFKYCLSALGKWDPTAYAHGYKGRTPLSSVISHRWTNQQRPHLVPSSMPRVN